MSAYDPKWTCSAEAYFLVPNKEVSPLHRPLGRRLQQRLLLLFSELSHKNGAVAAVSSRVTIYLMLVVHGRALFCGQLRSERLPW
jgi:hypothetical protein